MNFIKNVEQTYDELVEFCCPICLKLFSEVYKPYSPKKICEHSICVNCLNQFFLEEKLKRCPLCRRNVQIEDYFPPSKWELKALLLAIPNSIRRLFGAEVDVFSAIQKATKGLEKLIAIDKMIVKLFEKEISLINQGLAWNTATTIGSGAGIATGLLFSTGIGAVIGLVSTATSIISSVAISGKENKRADDLKKLMAERESILNDEKYQEVLEEISSHIVNSPLTKTTRKSLLGVVKIVSSVFRTVVCVKQASIQASMARGFSGFLIKAIRWENAIKIMPDMIPLHNFVKQMHKTSTLKTAFKLKDAQLGPTLKIGTKTWNIFGLKDWELWIAKYGAKIEMGLFAIQLVLLIADFYQGYNRKKEVREKITSWQNEIKHIESVAGNWKSLRLNE